MGWDSCFAPGGASRADVPDMTNPIIRKEATRRTRTVGLAGDWHANLPWALRALEEFANADIDTVYQVGDFGVWPGARGHRYLSSVNATCERLGIDLFVVPGNHEDYAQINAWPVDEAGWIIHPDLPMIRYAPRGHVWTDSGVSFGALGGAISIDKMLRIEGQTWWPEEDLTADEVERFIANAAALPNRLDVMLTHDAPSGVRRGGVTPSYLSPEIEHQARKFRLMLRDAADGAAPRWLVHGHWHMFVRDEFQGLSMRNSEYETQVLGLHMDDHEGNAVSADLIPGVGLTNLRTLLV